MSGFVVCEHMVNASSADEIFVISVIGDIGIFQIVDRWADGSEYRCVK